MGIKYRTSKDRQFLFEVVRDGVIIGYMRDDYMEPTIDMEWLEYDDLLSLMAKMIEIAS